METSQYFYLVGSWTMNDIGKFLLDESYNYNAVISPFTTFSGQYSSTSNNCYLSSPSSALQSLVICQNGYVYDSINNRCVVGQEMLIHFVGYDPSNYNFQFVSGSYNNYLSVEAWILPEFPGGDQYIYSHDGWAYFGITSSTLLAFLTSNQMRCETALTVLPNTWKHVTYRLTPSTKITVMRIVNSFLDFRRLEQ